MLLLPLDVGNYRDESDIYMNIFWYIIYCTSAVFIVLILPFGIFFYETDEEMEFVRRLLSYTYRNGDYGQLSSMN